MAGYKKEIAPDVWRLWVSAGFDADYNRIRPSKTFYGSERQAEKALALFVAEIERGNYEKPSKMIAKDLFKKWLASYGKFNLKPSTYDTYNHYLSKHVYDHKIGIVQVLKLGSADFYNLYSDLKDKKLSNKTILQIHRIMHSAFSDALSWPEIKLNRHPMLGIQAPRPEKKRINKLSEDEAQTLLIAALRKAPFWFFTFISLGLTTGLRRGELLGLRWMDIGENKLSVYQNVLRSKEHGLYIETPKDDEPRWVDVPEDTINILALYRVEKEKCHGLQEDKGLIFSTATGKPISPDDVSHRMQKFITDNKLPKVTIHGLRHTNATILINRGASLKEVSRQLGHSTTQITDTVYTEVFEAQRIQTANKLNGIIPSMDKPVKDNVILFRKAK